VLPQGPPQGEWLQPPRRGAQVCPCPRRLRVRRCEAESLAASAGVSHSSCRESTGATTLKEGAIADLRETDKQKWNGFFFETKDACAAVE
jgi:hypothetical protein